MLALAAAVITSCTACPLPREVNRSASVLPGGYNPNISALPQTCHRSLAGERLPLATSSPTPPSLCGWGHLIPPPTHGHKKTLVTVFHVCSFCLCLFLVVLLITHPICAHVVWRSRPFTFLYLGAGSIDRRPK